jgi:hypothetical protein
MKSLRRPAVTLLLMIGFLGALVLSITAVAGAEARPNAGLSQPEDWMDSLVASVHPAPLPPAETDTCQHCHLTGEQKNIFIPFSRWLLFGAFGMVFAYGAWRVGSTWTKRAPWTPIAVRAVNWVDERYQLKEPLTKALTKPVPTFATRWWYCLGGLSFALFGIQAVTGIMLAFYYQPTPEGAYASIQFIETQVRFGAAIRFIHHWAANGMVVMVIAHLVRVFITGAFKPPRELNWMSGVFLLVLTLAFGFTGYLLPWDQTAYWASTVGTEIAGAEPGIGTLALIFLRGGWEISGVTLSRFYALHIMVLPIVVLVFLGAHFLMIRRQGIARPL